MKNLQGMYTALLTLFTAEGKMEEARAVQNKSNRIIAILCKIGVMQAEKDIRNQLGFDFGECLPPFGRISEEHKALVAREIMPYIQAAD